jgi:hypothetical protein
MVRTGAVTVVVTRALSHLDGVAAVGLRSSAILCKILNVFIAANFPYLITPYEPIQNYVHQNSPDTVIQAVYNDFNCGAVSSIASPANLCMVFANADSGNIIQRLIYQFISYITVFGNAADRNEVNPR